MSYRVGMAALAAGFWLAIAAAAAQDRANYREIETKYIFGFTEGASIGLEGEKEVSAETVGAFGKRDGRYTATQTKLEFEQTPTQFIQLEFGALVASHHIKDVSDLDDRHSFNFGGLFGELRQLIIGRGPGSPLGVTVSVEPVWRRIDETSGERVTNFELESKLHVDTELVQNTLYLGFNALYEPEWTRTGQGEIEKESTFGVSAALALRLTEPLLVGMEVGYFRHYDGLMANTYTGDAIYVGPTLYWQIAPKSFMTAAWNTQVAGRAVAEPSPLNLADFPRHRAKLKVAVEF